MTWYDDILNFELLGNSGQDYLQAIITFLVTFLAILIFKRMFIIRLVRVLRKRDDQKKITELLASLRKILNFSFIFIVSIYVGSLQLNMDESLRMYLYFFVYAYVGYSLIKFTFAFVDFVISSKKLQENVDAQNILNFFRMMTKAVIFVLVLLWVLSNLGINVNAFVAGLGIFGLAIAFALQNIIADLFASIIIHIDNPFEVGDQISVGSESGIVESIGIRSSKIRTRNGHLLIIPNRDLSNSRIANYKRMSARRVVTTLGVHCDTPVAKLKELPAKIQLIIEAHEDVMIDRVHFSEISASSFDYEIVYKITTRDFRTFMDRKQSINLGLLELLENEGIQIPYPTQTIIMEKEMVTKP